MKKLLLAFALIGFIATSSFASTTIVETGSEIEFCEDGKKCDKKGCNHDKKATASKKACTKSKKACCSKASASKKSCNKGSKTAKLTKDVDTKPTSLKDGKEKIKN